MQNRAYCFKLESGQPIVECIKAATPTHAREKLAAKHKNAYDFDIVSDLPMSDLEIMYDKKLEFYQSFLKNKKV